MVAMAIYRLLSFLPVAMAGFGKLDASLTKCSAGSLAWTLCGVTGHAAIRRVLKTIKAACLPAADVCDALLGLSNDALEKKHARAFALFVACASPNAADDLRAETAKALTPFEESEKRHRLFLIERLKRQQLKP